VDKQSKSQKSRPDHSERGQQREALRGKRSGPTYQARVRLEAAKEWINIARYWQSVHCKDDKKLVTLSKAEQVLDVWIGRLRVIE
jgi:hypothetical protein